MRKWHVLTVGVTGAALVLVAGMATLASAADNDDHGGASDRQRYGVIQGIAHSSTTDLDAAAATADPIKLATLAKGLKARVMTAGNAAANLDMAALWPVDHPTHILTCNEQGTTAPGVQRINLTTGVAETIVTGTSSCDPLHVTPWGTVIFGEETTTGHVYEMVDPLGVTNATLDRTTGVASTPKIVRRDALGSVAFEGIGFLPSGVAYYGDELAPSNGAAGGAYYKFIPATPWNGSPVVSLDQSPLVAGTVSVLRVGQGSNTGPAMAQGDAAWLPISPDPATGSLRPGATGAHATGYYRPEDLAFDEKELTAGKVRFCGNNTGREQAHYYGETMCITDGSVAEAGAGTSTPQVQLFVVGTPEYAMPDNIAYQPGRGNWIIHEDGETDFERPHNNDLFSCQPDGSDDDLLSDGCLRIATLNDLSAEWTGGIFDASGEHFYVSVQHNKSGFGVILDITGWR
jgi:secreted PhoX family phosphatase